MRRVCFFNKIKSIWINKGCIFRIASTITGGVYALFGFVGVFLPLDEILSDKLSLLIRGIISVSVLLAIWLFGVVVVSVYMIHKKRFKILSVNNGHALYLQYGDIFDANEVVDSTKRRNIVVPVNRCFDTLVDNRIVSAQTVHGIAFSRLYASGKYTVENLSFLIDKSLKNTDYDVLSKKEKPEGKRKRYPVGTVVDLPGYKNEHFFLWALSTFDSNLKAHTSMLEYALAVQKLIESCNADSEGFPIVLPLVGAGLSRTKKEQQDILKYLISAFRINRTEINSDIHIVVHNDMKDEIAIMNIK